MKTPGGFYRHGVMMILIEVKLCHDKRRELNVYENLFVDFIDTEY
jgi:hypothetical protein